ncbi:MAG: hypothetical protein NFCOHLIN_00198 [Gammaproteobacteria bacterium]|nr:hypothetical protein [Gammaproteobacteria bacterium]
MSSPAARMAGARLPGDDPGFESPPPTSQPEMDAAVRRLRDGAQVFARLSVAERIRLCEAMQRGYLRMAGRSVLAGCRAKGIEPGTPAEAEEWATGTWGAVRQLRLVRESLQAIRAEGNTRVGPLARTADGRLSVRVFPGNAIDALLFKNVTVDVRMQAGVTEERLADTRASFYKRPPQDGAVVLVLGAGNIAAIPSMDVITKMFNEGRVCLLKMSPVNAYIGPFIEAAFAEPIRRGFLAVVYGGAEEGGYLTRHAGVDEVHITGSDKTHDAIVWGRQGGPHASVAPGSRPLLDKPITSELGNISPVIIVPGPYTERELQYQGEDAASYIVMNASFFCNAAKMLVLPTGWRGSDTFVQAVKEACRAVPPRRAYYPGAQERWRALTAGRAQVETLGAAVPGTLPWTFVAGLDAEDRSDPLFKVEPFCSLVSEVRVGTADPIEFLNRAVDFVNEGLWGTLSATLVVHPSSMRDPVVGPAVEQAIARLRYGFVSVNGFSGLGFVFAAPPWGAYPGSTLDDIQSGRGFVHNTAMLEGVEKVIMRHPLTAFPKPGYFVTHRTAHKLLPRLVAMEERGSWRQVPGIVFNAMCG